MVKAKTNKETNDDKHDDEVNWAALPALLHEGHEFAEFCNGIENAVNVLIILANLQVE